jgi:hypothetical protein
MKTRPTKEAGAEVGAKVGAKVGGSGRGNAVGTTWMVLGSPNNALASPQGPTVAMRASLGRAKRRLVAAIDRAARGGW